MLRVSHAKMVFLSGLIWMIVGCILLPMGLNLLVDGTHQGRFLDTKRYPLIDSLAPYLGGLDEAAVLLIGIGLVVGHLKGRYILGKAAKRGIQRILGLPNPANLGDLFSFRYYLLISLMIGLGMSMKFLGLPSDLRGTIDVAIGSALISSAMTYFREAVALRQKQFSQ